MFSGKHERISRMALTLLSAGVVAGCVGRTVSFEHKETHQLTQNDLARADVPDQFRIGGAVLGMQIVDHRDRYTVVLLVFFEDIHEDIVVSEVSLSTPVQSALPLTNPTWEPYEREVVEHLTGFLTVAEIREPLRRELVDGDGDLTVTVTLDVGNRQRLVEFRLQRKVRWWPPVA